MVSNPSVPPTIHHALNEEEGTEDKDAAPRPLHPKEAIPAVEATTAEDNAIEAVAVAEAEEIPIGRETPV